MDRIQIIDVSRLLNQVPDRADGSRIKLATYALRADNIPRERRAADLWADGLTAIVHPPGLIGLAGPRI